MNLPGKYNQVTTQYVDNVAEKEILIQSLKYLPSFLQDKDLFKDASKLLDACLSEEDDILAQIHEAYCDTLYKISAYEQLSYGAKTELLKEKGFEYILQLLKHIYEERYNQLPVEKRKQITLEQYLEQQTASNLSNITMLFNLLYILKGKTLGLELALKLVNCPEYIYLTWDIVANYKGSVNSWEELPLPGGEVEVEKGDAYTVSLGDSAKTDAIFNGVSWHKCTSYEEYLTPRQQFTAELTIWGMASSTLQVKIADFVRNYMLPYIEIKLKFSDSVDAIMCFPSGDRSLLHCYNLSHYYDNGKLIKHNLEHDVSQQGWSYTDTVDLPITMGQPIAFNKAFQGNVDLNNSFLQRNGKKYPLYGKTKTVPEFISGPALNTLTEEGTVTFDGNTYIQSPTQMDYTIVDIVTGDQINPHYQGDDFIRDTIIKFNQHLTVGGIHLNKTVQQMQELLIEDFDKYIGTEVYAGRATNVTCENKSNVMFFDTSIPTVREKTGVEDTVHLKFSDATVNNKYTGIGDLGILGSNTYFIYNGMLFYNKDGIKQIGGDTTWTDVGASHSVSNTYYTPAINNGKLVYLKEDKISQIKNSQGKTWKLVTGYINEQYSAFAVANDGLYRIYLDDDITISKIDSEQWTYITGAYYSNTYEAYGIKNKILYRLSTQVNEIKLDNKTLTGWDTSFDCISRYHHSNNDYITYGICNGNLYGIQDTQMYLLDSNGWTNVCGFYNENSPRTFGYGIKNGNLYELQGKNIVLKDSGNWTDITGCTTSVNTFVLGIKNNEIYQINAKTLKQLSDTTGWTDVFGRYTTSTSKNANCYAYGIRYDRLHVLNLSNDSIVPGVWKVNGQGPSVDLKDYNIEDITVRVNGQIIRGIDNVRTTVPVADEDPSTYDIYVTYETVGFENNTRYEVKTEMSEVYRTYINPSLCRDNIDMTNCPEFNTETGNISNFTTCPLTIHGKQKINGQGEAYEFSLTNYLEIPEFYDISYNEFNEEVKTLKPITEAVFKIGCIVEKEMLPIILDENGNGIYYGYSNDLMRSGIFIKNNTITKLISVEQGQNKECFIKLDSVYNVYYSLDGKTYTNSNQKMGSPKYLGSNGVITGDSIIYLNESYVKTDDIIYLYEKGKYFGLDTLNQDVITRIITPENQESQKVIEIQNMDKSKALQLDMNSMYVSRTNECSNDKLQIQDDFVKNTLNFGDNEGITTSKLIYSGEYTLDPEKAKDVGNIKNLSGYNYNSFVNNFSTEDYLQVSPEVDLVIKTGSNVKNQTLFQTEEHTAYTNKYLLTSEISGTYTNNGVNTPLDLDKTKQRHVVPSGIIYELITDKPGNVTRKLEYNAEQFEIDDSKISYYEQFNFDSYTALLSGFTSYYQDQIIDTLYAQINLDLQQKSKVNNIINYNVKPILNIVTGNSYIQKIAQLGEFDINIGNKFKKYVDSEGNQVDPDTYQGEYTVTDLTDTTLYPWEDNTKYWLKFNIAKQTNSIENVKVHETTSTEPKDKLQTNEGTIWNFSNENYLLTTELTTQYGLQLKYITDDDVSKDQGLFGLPNGQAIAIKDHEFVLVNGTNIIEVSQVDITDEEELFIKLDNDEQTLTEANVYIKFEEDEEWEPLFENKIQLQDQMYIGYANTGIEPLPFNGKIDLTRSFVTDVDNNKNRYYDFKQITTINISKDGKTYDTQYPIVITTEYPVDVLRFGYSFAGSLDMYGSELLLPYTLEWLEDRISINTRIKQELAQADPTYDPELDKTIYTIKEYGVHLSIPEQRWDTVSIDYVTVDNAYYMMPNTTYYLKCDVELDENGKCLVNKVDNPTWKSGIVSQFNNGYYTHTFTNEQYLVLHAITKDTSDQGLAGYVNGGQQICIKDGKWQFFDDTNYHVICEAKPNESIYFKLYRNSNKIEYYVKEWIKTDITAGFSGYETFMLGRTHNNIFNGSINLNDSYIVTDGINYLFTLYKKITPYISQDKKTWKSLVLEPILTIKNMINFGQGFSGTLFLYESNLLLEDATYWTCNQINVYAMHDIPEDNIKANDLVRTIIRDTYLTDNSEYWTEDVTIKIDPKDLKLIVTGLPIVGDVITLTYDSWYLFRKMNHEYDFKVTYTANSVQISYKDIETEKEYLIYEMDKKPYKLNIGYNFWATLSVKDSYRGGMMLCNYLEWYRYIISYRKYGDLDWIKWSEFSRESRYEVYQRTGFDLKGVLYMETSYVKVGNLLSPFLAYWDGTYVTIVGGPDITNGIVSQFSENDYLLIKPESLINGDIISFTIDIKTLVNQGIGTCVTLQDEYICNNDNRLQKVYENFKAIIEYHIIDNKVYARIVGNNTSNFNFKKSNAYTLTIIPYNKDLQESQSGYYVKSLEDAQKLRVLYRVGDTHYDHFNPPTLEWHPVTLQKIDELKYFGTVLKDIYVAKINFGYTYDKAGNAKNTNPDNIEYLDMDDIEYKIIGDITTTNKTVLYADKIEKQKTKF